MTEVSDSAPDRTSRPAEGAETQEDVVELAVPARTAYVSVLRSTASALAARLDFTLDEIDDLRIAVDEASALLLAQAIPDSQLSCRFRLSGDELVVSVTAESKQPHVPAHESFAWTVLTALAGPVDAVVDPPGRRTTLTLTKRAEAVQASSQKFGGDIRHLETARSARGEKPTGDADAGDPGTADG